MLLHYCLRLYVYIFVIWSKANVYTNFISIGNLLNHIFTPQQQWGFRIIYNIIYNVFFKLFTLFLKMNNIVYTSIIPVHLKKYQNLIYNKFVSENCYKSLLNWNAFHFAKSKKLHYNYTNFLE